MIDDVEQADNPNQEYFINQVFKTVGQVEETVSKLSKISSQVLETIEKQKLTMDESNQKEFPIIPSLDPALRSKHLTDNPKTYLLQIGPNQPNLQAYPSNSNIAKESHKLLRFNPSWFKKYLYLEYSLSIDSAFCFVLYLEVVQERRKQKMLGVEKVCDHGINSRAVEKQIVASWQHISHQRVTIQVQSLHI